MMKLSYFGPFSPIKSGIADYSEEILPYLKRYFDVDVFIDNYLPTKIKKYNLFYDFKNKYDANLFQVGNGREHAYMYPLLKKYSGVIVMHDLNLHGMIWSWAIEKSHNRWAFLKEMWLNHGIRGSSELFKAFFLNTMGIPRYKIDIYRFPINKTVINFSKGVIVHNNYMKKEVEKINKKIPVEKINHGAKLINLKRTKEQSRKFLNLGKYDFVICSFGFVQKHKRINQVLTAFKEFLKEYPNSIYVICGKKDDGYDIDDAIKNLGLEKNTIVTDYVPRRVAYEYINASDLCFNLRWPTTGATSGGLIDILSVGRPCVVSNINEYREFSDDYTFKVDLDDKETKNLKKIMVKVREDPKLRDRMGKKAKEYTRRDCSWREISKQYSEFIRRVQKP